MTMITLLDIYCGMCELIPCNNSLLVHSILLKGGYDVM